MMNKVCVTLFSYCWLIGIASHTYSQAPLISQSITTLDPVYTDQQSRRRARIYNRVCSECHEGDEPDADPLIGLSFIERWREAPLSFLFNFISKEMPGDEPGSFESEAYLEVLAFLLDANDYPAGNEALTLNNVENILLVGGNGPQPLPNYSLIKVVGCLTPLNNDNWHLTSASLMERVRSADETSTEEMNISRSVPLADKQYLLRNNANYNLESFDSQKLQIKGVLTSQSETITISVLSLESLSSEC